MKRQLGFLAGLILLLTACGVTAGNQRPSSTDNLPDEGPSPTSTSRQDGSVVPDHLLVIEAAWGTDFGNSIIDLNELKVGIAASDPRDAIRPIDSPVFETVAQSSWIADREPGVFVEVGRDARFYPLSILTRHEIVNDEFGDVAVAVTFCPLCNTGVVFDRRFDGDVLRLGVSGLLRNSDLVMWDDSTQTLWQQITGEAIVGDHAGARLTLIPSAIVRWEDFKTEHPEGTALANDQGYGSVYGQNPYEFYSSREAPYGFFTGEIDDRFPALERVVGVTINETKKAYPFSALSKARVVNDIIDGQPVAIFWGAANTADALDRGTIAESTGIGTALALDPVVNGQTLTFEAAGDTEFTDFETGTTWTILGTATSGELSGKRLEIVPHRNEFWFAWQAFFPEGEVWVG